jgi:hypothetical protein
MVDTEEQTDKEYALHNDCLSEFNNRLYEGIFTEENIVSTKKSVSWGDEKFYGYFMEKGKEKFFALDEHVNQLPFKVEQMVERDYKTDVFNVILKVKPIQIPATKNLSFKELVDIMPAFKHSNPQHFVLYKICAITGYVDRVNFRVSTEPGFGKDSVVSIMAHLVDSSANLYGATMAKLEYVLKNKMIILNELGNLKGEEKINIQEFLLAVGAYFNTYTKRSRKTESTQEQYDISKLSLILFYNLPAHYTAKGQEYFDQMFTSAVVNRFIPFVFDGRLTTSFERLIDVSKIVTENENTYKNIIATLNYYRQNPLVDIKYEVDTSEIKFPKTLMRYDRSFNILLKYIGEYSQSQEEFDMLSKELFRCYKKYDGLIETERKIK